MSDPYLGEIRVASFNFPPRGWAFCNGQQLPINQNQALFSILGTQYGGNGVTTFALPNLQGRMPIGQSAGYVVGNSGGEAAHTLTSAEMPTHQHVPQARTEPSSPGGTSPTNGVWAPTGRTSFAAAPDTTLNELAVTTSGGSQPHENRAPFLALNFVIALVGIFPSRN